MPKLTRGTLLALLMITIAGAAMRCRPIGESLWLDELHTAWTVLAPDGELASRAWLGNNSPLYFRVVRCLTQIAGTSEWSLRLISLVAGTLLIPLTFAVCRSWRLGLAPALMAATLVALDRHASFYACEARPYALVQLLALAHMALYGHLLIDNDRTWTWITWTLTGVILFQLHCTTALFVAAEAIAFGLLLWLRYPIKVQTRYLIIGFIVIGLSILSSVGLLQALADRRENWSHFVQTTRQPLQILWLYPLHAYLLAPLLAGSTAVALRLGLGHVGEIEPREEGDIQLVVPLVLCVACLFVPIVAAWVLTELDVTRIFLRRYLIASSVTLAPLSAMIVRYSVSGKRSTLLVVFAIVAFALFSIRPRLDSRVQEDWRSAIANVNDVPRDEPLLFYSGLIEADPWWDSTDPSLIAYCQYPLRALYPLGERRVILLPRSVDKIGTVLVGDTSAAWLLIRSSDAKRPAITQAVQAALGPQWTPRQQTAYERLTLLRLVSSVED